jgi:hypothetical protein
MASELNQTNTYNRPYVYRVLRYAPDPVRDEWVNIGVLVFDEAGSERRLRIIEEPEEFARVRRLHPSLDESGLRKLRNDLEDRLAMASQLFAENRTTPGEGNGPPDWLKLLGKWDETLSLLLQLAPQKGVYARDIDTETERLYADEVAPKRGGAKVSVSGSRGMIRSYCAQVLRQARLWERVQKGVRAEEFTFPGDPMRIDYGYRKNGTRGFVQTLSVTRAPGDVKSLAYTVERIRGKLSSSEFTAVTDVHLIAENERHRFVLDTLRDARVEAVPWRVSLCGQRRCDRRFPEGFRFANEPSGDCDRDGLGRWVYGRRFGWLRRRSAPKVFLEYHGHQDRDEAEQPRYHRGMPEESGREAQSQQPTQSGGKAKGKRNQSPRVPDRQREGAKAFY